MGSTGISEVPLHLAHIHPLTFEKIQQIGERWASDKLSGWAKPWLITGWWITALCNPSRENWDHLVDGMKLVGMSNLELTYEIDTVNKFQKGMPSPAETHRLFKPGDTSADLLRKWVEEGHEIHPVPMSLYGMAVIVRRGGEAGLVRTAEEK